MREALKTKEVLTMYDVRGIQNYIFRTNRIKEIIGASAIVENIIVDGLAAIIRELGLDAAKYLLDWENDAADAYFNDSEIQMQVMFIGGGNAYVLFRKGEICEKFNRKLAKYVLEHTYSLQLAVAVVERTESYSNDYEKINLRMREIKATMPSTKPMGAFPFMAVDSVTGFPLVAESPYGDGYVCQESLLKLKACAQDKDAKENLLDNLVTEKGENSFLAIVHIDGNNMGKRIKAIMQDKDSYVEAVQAMRSISKKLKHSFEDAFAVMGVYIDERSRNMKKDAENKLYRKLILAGDDITFICNAMLALDAVRVFLQNVSKCVMYGNSTNKENLKVYGLSACAGIAFARSHFPFRDAYEVAEACCASAKKRAKEQNNRANGKSDGNIGNYMDFQICNHVKTTDLEEHREKNYAYADGTGSIIYRPYYVSCEVYEELNDLNVRNQAFDFEKIFVANMKKFKKQSISRNKMKDLRNAFAFGRTEVDKNIIFLASRGLTFADTNPDTWYDALEMMDLYDFDGGDEA